MIELNMNEKDSQVLVCGFYRFVALDGLAELQRKLYAVLYANAVRGTILLATEGINATIAGECGGVRAVMQWLDKQPGLGGLAAKESVAAEIPFGRTKVKIKKEIVTMGVTAVAVDGGEYVAPQNWNAVLADENTLVVDTRNQYEIARGSFGGAINPRIDNFREFPEFAKRELKQHKQKRVAMFCTGGIRCEKAAAYLKQNGFERVVQLQGGILNYLAKTPAAKSKWRGECFVFDDRVAVGSDGRPQ